MFGVVPKVLWSRVYPVNEQNLITLTLRSLVVETGDHIILVDSGWGDKQDEKFFRHVYQHNGEGLVKGLKAGVIILRTLLMSFLPTFMLTIVEVA